MKGKIRITLEVEVEIPSGLAREDMPPMETKGWIDSTLILSDLQTLTPTKIELIGYPRGGGEELLYLEEDEVEPPI
jgi:hypothetical protein